MTNADGTTTLKTLAQLNIKSIDLQSNNHREVLSDGSEIAGTARFTRTDNTTGKAADARLAYETAGHIVERTVTGNPDGTSTVATSAFNADGSLANAIGLTVGLDGIARTLFDDDGDGVNDRLEAIGSSVDANTPEPSVSRLRIVVSQSVLVNHASSPGCASRRPGYIVGPCLRPIGRIRKSARRG